MNKRRLALGGMIVAAVAIFAYGRHHEVELFHAQEPIEAQVVVEHDAELKMVCRSEIVDVCWPAIVHQHTGRLIVQDTVPWEATLRGKVHRWQRGDVQVRMHRDGKRWAIRHGEGPWRAVYAGDHGRGFFYGKVPSNLDGDIDWSAVPDFNEAAPRLFRKASYEERIALLADIQERASAKDFRRFMVKVAGMRPRGTVEQRMRGGAWADVYQTLPAGDRERIATAMRRTFLKRSLSNNRLVRTLRIIDLDDPRVVRRIDRILEGSPHTYGMRRRAEALMLRTLMRHDPAAASRHACRMASRIAPEDLTRGGATGAAQLREAILAAIAGGPWTCETITQAAEQLDPAPRFASLGSEAAARIVTSVRDRNARSDLWSLPRRQVPKPELELLLRAAAQPRPSCGG